MTRNPDEPGDKPQEDRAAERLRDHMMGRFPPGTFPSPGEEDAGGEDAGGEETPEETEPNKD